jgi:membrane protease YdiL (CAAX protease family)
MSNSMGSTKAATRVALTAIPDSWRWMKPDLVTRLLPFAAACTLAQVIWKPRWLGFSGGDVRAQLIFGLAAAPVLFVTATLVQLVLSRRRGALSAPAGPADASFQAAFYVVNGPIEEALFRGLIQGGLGALTVPALGFVVGTTAYVLYHRLGWGWPETLATALIGIPLGIAFWVLPGPPSLLGVSIAHIAATCGFLGPGPYLLRKLRFV